MKKSLALLIVGTVALTACATSPSSNRKVASTADPKAFIKAVENCFRNPSSHKLEVGSQRYWNDSRITSNLVAIISCKNETAKNLYEFLDSEKRNFFLNADRVGPTEFIEFGRNEEGLNGSE